MSYTKLIPEFKYYKYQIPKFTTILYILLRKHE